MPLQNKKLKDFKRLHRLYEAGAVFTAFDTETTGLKPDTSRIIEIGAVKITGNREIEFHRMIRVDVCVPDKVRSLTGITDEMLQRGIDLKSSIYELKAYIQDVTLVGYNIAFDINFLNRACEKCLLEPIHNKTVELMNEAKTLFAASKMSFACRQSIKLKCREPSFV